MRSPARDRQGFPLGRAEVFHEDDDLTHVVGVMGHLPVDGLDHRMTLAPDVDVAKEIVGRKRIEGRE